MKHRSGLNVTIHIPDAPDGLRAAFVEGSSIQVVISPPGTTPGLMRFAFHGALVVLVWSPEAPLAISYEPTFGRVRPLLDYRKHNVSVALVTTGPSETCAQALAEGLQARVAQRIRCQPGDVQDEDEGRLALNTAALLLAVCQVPGFR